jgi:hypothetical protein
MHLFIQSKLRQHTAYASGCEPELSRHTAPTSMPVCVCVYLCVIDCVCVWVGGWVWEGVRARVRVRVCWQVKAGVCECVVDVCVLSYTCSGCVFVSCIYTNLFICFVTFTRHTGTQILRTSLHIRVQTRTHTHTHKHTHTHTHKQTHRKKKR